MNLLWANALYTTNESPENAVSNIRFNSNSIPKEVLRKLEREARKVLVSRKPNRNQSSQMLEKLKRSTCLNSLIGHLLKKSSRKLIRTSAPMSGLKC